MARETIPLPADMASQQVYNIPALKGRIVWVDEPYMSLAEGTGAVVFEAKAKADLNVALATHPAGVLPSQDGRGDGAPEFELVIGGWLNTKTALRVDGKVAAAGARRHRQQSAG